MGWFRLDDKSHMNAKVAAAGNAAWGLYTRCGPWSCDNLTDGYIPIHIARQYGTKAEIARCLAAHLWVVVEDAPFGLGRCYHMPDFLEFNKSREDALVERADAAERQRRARAAAKASRHGDVTAVSQRDNGVSHGPVTAVSRSPRPDPTPLSITSPDRQTLPACPSVVEEAVTLYAQAIHDRNPAACKTTPDRYRTGIARAALTEHHAALDRSAHDGLDAPTIAASVLGVTETELIRYGAITPEDPIERAVRRNQAERERLGLTPRGAA